MGTIIETGAARPRAHGLQRPVSLSEVLDRVLNKGAVVVGEVVISIADIDLIYLGVNVVLTSVETARTSKQLKEPPCHTSTSDPTASA